MFYSDNHRNPKKKKNGDAGKYKKVIHGHTGYFLAGVIPVGSAGRLNCYKKSKKLSQAEEQFKRAQSHLAKVKREEKAKLRKEQDRHKYMMGGCVVKYFPEAYDFSELEMNRIIACAFSLEDVQNMIQTVISERTMPEPNNDVTDDADFDTDDDENDEEEEADDEGEEA